MSYLRYPTAINDNVAGEIALITEKTTPVSADLLLLEDSADSNNKKKLQVGNLPSGSGSLQLVELLDQTFSGQSSVDVDCTGYDQVLFIWQDVDFSLASRPGLRVSTDGVTFDDTSTDYHILQLTDTSQTDQELGYMLWGGDVNAASQHYGEMVVSNLASPSHQTTARGIGGDQANGNTAARYTYRKAEQVDTHLRFYSAAGGTIDAGKLRVLGVGAVPVVPSGGGSLQLVEIADHTFTGESSVNIDVTGYDQVQLIWDDVDLSVSTFLALRVSTDGFSSDLGDGASDYRRLEFSDTTNTTNNASSAIIGPKQSGQGDKNGVATIYNLSSATYKTKMVSVAGQPAAGRLGTRLNYVNAAQVDTHLQIRTSGAATIDAGKLRVLGVGQSTAGGTGGPAVLKCRARPASDLTGKDASGPYVIPFDSEDFDDGTWHNNVTNNTRFTVPASAKDKVDIVGYCRVSGVTAGVPVRLQILKDGAFYVSSDGSEPIGNIIQNQIVLIDDECVPGTTYYELRISGGDASVTVETETNLSIRESIQTHSDGHTINASTPDANVQGVVGQIDVITMLSMTADRDYLLPATAAVGQIAGLSIVDGDPDYEVLIKTGAAGDKINNVDHSTNEFTRLFIAGERMVFECIDAAGPHWQVKEDGRIPCKCTVTRDAAQSLTGSGTEDKILIDNADIDIGNLADITTNDRINIRRNGEYEVIVAGAIDNLDGAQRAWVKAETNSTEEIIVAADVSPATNKTLFINANTLHSFNAADWVELKMQKDGSSENTYTTDWKPKMHVIEQL